MAREGARIQSQRDANSRASGRRIKRRDSSGNAQAPLASLREPTESELIMAVESLYKDELRPYGRILRKRLAEFAEERGSDAPHPDLARLQIQCSNCVGLEVHIESGVEWSVTRSGIPADFVDIYGTEDPYTEEFWSEAADFFEHSQLDDMNYPGGRYVCAQGLASRGLRFLEGYSLGRICHFVQLAMSSRKLLGYCNGAIVPYDRSETMLKERCAEQQRLCKKAKLPPMTNWNVFRACLRELLDAHIASNGMSDGLPLSNIKRLFRSRFQADLSETALGHATVCDLFRDDRLKEDCSIRLLENGYHVFPVFVASSETSVCAEVLGDVSAGKEGNRGSHICGKRQRRRCTSQSKSTPCQQGAQLLAQVPCAPVTFSHGSTSSSTCAFSTAPLDMPITSFAFGVAESLSTQSFVGPPGHDARTDDAAWYLTCQALGLAYSGCAEDEGSNQFLVNASIGEEHEIAPFAGLALEAEGKCIDVDEGESNTVPATPDAMVPPTPSPMTCGKMFDFSLFAGSPLEVSRGSAAEFGVSAETRSDQAADSTDVGSCDESCSAPSTPRLIVGPTPSPCFRARGTFDMLLLRATDGAGEAEVEIDISDVETDVPGCRGSVVVASALTAAVNLCPQMIVRNTFIDVAEPYCRAESCSPRRSASTPPVAEGNGRRKSV